MELITNSANERILKLTDEESDAIEEAASLSELTVSEFVTEAIEMAVFVAKSEDDEYEVGDDDDDDGFDEGEEDGVFSLISEESKEALRTVAKRSGAAIADIISDELKK